MVFFFLRVIGNRVQRTTVRGCVDVEEDEKNKHRSELKREKNFAIIFNLFKLVHMESMSLHWYATWIFIVIIRKQNALFSLLYAPVFVAFQLWHPPRSGARCNACVYKTPKHSTDYHKMLFGCRSFWLLMYTQSAPILSLARWLGFLSVCSTTMTAVWQSDPFYGRCVVRMCMLYRFFWLLPSSLLLFHVFSWLCANRN